MLKYLIKLQQSEIGQHTFHLITFEQSTYALNDEGYSKLKDELEINHSIIWYPKKYNTGGALMLFKKAYDFLSAFLLAFKLKSNVKLESIIGFTSISGAIASFISRLLKLKLVLLNIEPHSDYMADFGFWSKKSIKYKLLKYFEDKMIIWADKIAVPTMNAYRELIRPSLDGKLYFVPTCIDTNDFNFNEGKRNEIRDSIGVPSGAKVVLYLGKFGGIYYTIDQAAEAFLEIQGQSENIFFYVITPDDEDQVKSIFKDNGLAGNSFVRGRINYEEISGHISAADFGIMLVPSYPSQKFRCPIKTANYLACGIPYIITPSIGDDSYLAEAEHIGIVIKDDSQINLDISVDQNYLQQSVKKHRGIHLVVDWLKVVLN